MLSTGSASNPRSGCFAGAGDAHWVRVIIDGADQLNFGQQAGVRFGLGSRRAGAHQQQGGAQQQAQAIHVETILALPMACGYYASWRRGERKCADMFLPTALAPWR